MQPKVLVVDDDLNICEIIKIYLGEEGYELHFAHDGTAALNSFRDVIPDLIILDLGLPVISGQEVCRMIRRESQVPIIMLTAKDSTRDKIEGLDAGADDYLVKPFEPLELSARVRARLRRSSASPDNEDSSIVMGDLKLNLKKFEVTIDDQLVDLKPKEVNLLHFFLINKNTLFTREQLLDKVWGYDYVGETRTVDVHIRRLREKLGSSKSLDIKTIWGMGYRLEEKN
ncbi:MAG: response regulator transcription factor [Ignavibacteriales bacterium]